MLNKLLQSTILLSWKPMLFNAEEPPWHQLADGTERNELHRDWVFGLALSSGWKEDQKYYLTEKVPELKMESSILHVEPLSVPAAGEEGDS